MSVIEIENLSKYYRLGVIGGGTLREDTNRIVAKFRGQPDPLLRIGEADYGNRKDGQIWALKDVNLSIKEGEILGIVGGNGAGKSTLLKILSRITAPTDGKVKIKGRVGSLLEVGTGFHPELTGRENIYLNGTILGMTRQEIKRKLDEIIEFAGMGKFIDTPAKRYSSGMTVRLAFSVAAHLDPEILIVDEVLAVGDAAFQKKCLGKMQDVAKGGRTILFVSHSMPSVRNLCTKAVFMEKGQLNKEGKVEDIIKTYLTDEINKSASRLKDRTDRRGSGRAKITGLELIGSEDGQSTSSGDKLTYKLTIESTLVIEKPLIYFGIFDMEGNEIVHINSRMKGEIFPKIQGHKSIDIIVEKLSLTPGTYRIDIGVLDGSELVDLVSSAETMVISEGDYYGSGYLGPAIKGKVLIEHNWNLN